MTVHHLQLPIFGERFNYAYSVDLRAFVGTRLLPLRTQVSGLASHLMFGFPVHYGDTGNTPMTACGNSRPLSLFWSINMAT